MDMMNPTERISEDQLRQIRNDLASAEIEGQPRTPEDEKILAAYYLGEISEQESFESLLKAAGVHPPYPSINHDLD
ncbi:hypothetical protein AY498_02990 [Corynebacterium ulcerans]|uniref:Antitoxin VbhA domain-containing protein n=5 Tax=Corynebacteriaceae TaxID=1653 RepID=A0ABD0BE10_CORUL|nr:hypothetical protein CULC809_00027 [Corynebacterium ulcerans 809]AEG82748.1 hypothetical protein CULC22_00026 [Corynebacterium ulcerans BR-AD22]AIT88010.1 Hypothetical protein Cul210932_0029 [Corynebacterium ulcerans]AIU31636.1 Hypothetical protein CulFRC11_0030 [Corynebacterium ramonii FRC0011]AKN75880.1 Hypothetical protein CulFRC58_0026 [Corynebacterium ulcerans FRC58]ESU59170.1 hypothetical protein D881_00600 [Corynebacterium ulcerans NCTC 12077]